MSQARVWGCLAAVAILGFGLWLLLVSRTVTYELNESDEPVGVVVTYDWSADAENRIALWPRLIPDDKILADNLHLVIRSVRVGCGSVFTGPDDDAPPTRAACSQVETSPRIGGIALVLLGAVGLGLARRIRSGPARRYVRGDTDLFGTDDLGAVDHPVLGEDPDGDRA